MALSALMLPVLALLSLAAGCGSGGPGASAGADPPFLLGFTASAGAAPGYVSDRACARCHHALYTSYQEVGMARSFYRPRAENLVEDFERSSFFHEPSRQHFALRREGDRLVFRRHQLDAEGQPIHLIEEEVDWILGSGNHSRVYLYQTPWGELYQLPIAWYSQTRSWGMAPGFDRPDHDGLSRRVRRECMFCHNAYPEVPAGSDRYGEPQLFPASLPEGTGCQRCHGPGALHVETALSAEATGERVRAAIVNPGRLPAERRDDVCLGCHMQPSVALPGLRRFGVGDYSFRPGTPLADYLVQLDVDEEGRERGERFEINHHPYRLRQSRCYEASRGALSCLTCHDPHEKVPGASRAAHFRRACLTCHADDACRREATGAAGAHGLTMPEGAGEADDCVACHMPKRRTQDVVRVVMTDHRIQRRPGGPELLAPLAERDPVLVGVEHLDRRKAPEGALGEVYRAAAVVRAVASEAATEHLGRMLEAAKPVEIEPYLDLAEGELKRRRFAPAEKALRGILERAPDHPLAREWLGLALAGQGREEEAIAILEKLVSGFPERPEALFNLGLLLVGEGRDEAAIVHLGRATTLRPNLAPAWFYLGTAQGELGRLAEATASFERALALDPTHTRASIALARTFAAAGRRAEALRTLRHAATAAARPEEVARELLRLEGAGG